MSIIETSIDAARQRAMRDKAAAAEQPARKAGAATASPPRKPLEPANAQAPKLSLSPSVLNCGIPDVDPQAQRVVAGQYRTLRRSVLDRAFTNPVAAKERLIVVSSSVSGEGKTHTSLNLAVSLAQDEARTVLLVDGDLPKRDLSRRFGVLDHRGLADCLVDEDLDVRAIVSPTSADRLMVLPAGQAWRAGAELIGTARFAAFLGAILIDNPDLIVLVDAGPILQSPEAELVSREAGHLLLVVRAGSTSRKELADAVALLDEGQSVSLILNAWEASRFGEAPYYGKYYGTD